MGTRGIDDGLLVDMVDVLIVEAYYLLRRLPSFYFLFAIFLSRVEAFFRPPQHHLLQWSHPTTYYLSICVAIIYVALLLGSTK